MVQTLIPQDVTVYMYINDNASGPDVKQIQKRFLKHQIELITRLWPLINPFWVYISDITGRAQGFLSERMM